MPHSEFSDSVTHQEIKSWYNRRYASRGRESMRPPEAYAIFLDYLHVQPGQKLLDVSCGVGHLLLQASHRQLRTFGIDISAEAVRIAHTTTPNSGLCLSAGENLPLASSQFDYLVCLGSLEHFLCMESGLREMRRVARPEATLCLMVPNSNFWIWKLKGKLGTEQQDINEHLLSLQEWQALFRSHGFRIVKIYPDQGFLKAMKPFSSRNPIKILGKIACKFLGRLLPLRFAYQLIFILEQ